ncbi:HAMP domain-containing histidine kinase [Martelella lutilitoris]|uniref:histidine kinase n=1 Tax=Martelella lutilitoris TaxID=2583532 RepID=A0A5C4JNU6_9HYPH|nr:HAMP domain-containing sensor histidine kinase [Martelella lutilitoris]TNB47008.1 HAMP domain-containing histidine kinase [Martelella lutilitoris]
MTERLRLLFKSTAVRLSAVYILLFGLCAAVMVFYVTAVSEDLVLRQTRTSLEREVTQLDLAFESGGIRRVFNTIERRARQPGANLYVIASPQGEILASNVASLQPGVLNRLGWVEPPFRYEGFAENNGGLHENLAAGYVIELDNGIRLLIGRDLGDPERLHIVVRQALLLALIIMGVGALVIWFAIGRNALKRMDRMSSASGKIMAGDLSQRLPVTGSGDEFDRLSNSLNLMLDRIVRLNEGLRQVSDNIAHDLKTPLTRLRNKAADAAATQDPDDRRAALEGIIAESDQLIRTFNALLMISRVEAGAVAAEMSVVNLSAIVEDSAELYGPVAEEAGLVLDCAIERDISVSGNRELIGQAIFNLLDNAIKYSEGCGQSIHLSLKREGGQAVFVVADNGPGIPPSRMDDVKQRFFRLDESRSKPGTGLGLSLVEAVASMHGGVFSLVEAGSLVEGYTGLAAVLRFEIVSEKGITG